MIDLDKWAARIVVDEELEYMQARFASWLHSFPNDPRIAFDKCMRPFVLAARPTDAPVLVDPARLRELEADAARYRGLRNVAANGTPSLEREFDGQVDEALQEQPNV